MSFPYQPGCVAAVMFLGTGCGQEGRTSSLQLEAGALACLSKQLLYHQPGPRLPSFRLKGYLLVRYPFSPTKSPRMDPDMPTCPGLVARKTTGSQSLPQGLLKHCRLLLQI